MRLLLVRHGQTPSNVHGLLDTATPGADLTDLGRLQAQALVAALGHEPVDALLASTLVRTQQTAAPLAATLGLEVQVRAGLREITAGDLEMLGDPASIATYLGTAFAWSAGRLDLRMPGGESGHEVYARYDAVLEDLAASGVGTAVAVSHGAIIRSWCAARAGVPVAHVEAHPLTNTGVVVLDGSPSAGWSALTWEDHAIGGLRVESPDDGPAGEAFLE
ncbi:histidine phosphatase family protein [Actinotalea sp.]|uniref:histidine phosphatase family protein n=1 Tax=Actinotalea sp. TaxID=1872145 RepID=UPI002C837F11|nr:histidine phosphatase family protein [Actinotalea sp.]HQY34696.1 histidine phosphatase family protein [Actinotalea sp.]HRA51816.1 histidine phosphatase family protein [Actinotalea sp.]